MPERRRIKGDRGVRRLLRQIPDAARLELLAIMEEGGRELLAAEQADAPVRRGGLRAALSMKLLKGSMRLKVGLIGKPVNRRFFYGRIVESGRKAKTVTAKRRSRKTGKVYSYQMRISALPPRPFVYSRRTDLRRVFRERLNRFWEGTLAKAAEGVTDA